MRSAKSDWNQGSAVGCSWGSTWVGTIRASRQDGSRPRRWSAALSGHRPRCLRHRRAGRPGRRRQLACPVPRPPPSPGDRSASAPGARGEPWRPSRSTRRLQRATAPARRRFDRSQPNTGVAVVQGSQEQRYGACCRSISPSVSTAVSRRREHVPVREAFAQQWDHGFRLARPPPQPLRRGQAGASVAVLEGPHQDLGDAADGRPACTAMVPIASTASQRSLLSTSLRTSVRMGSTVSASWSSTTRPAQPVSGRALRGPFAPGPVPIRPTAPAVPSAPAPRSPLTQSGVGVP